MAGLNFDIRMPRRRATVDVNSYWERKLGIPKGETPCYVLGIFQDSSDDGPYPVAVCELNDGRVLSTEPDRVKFVDTKDGVME